MNMQSYPVDAGMEWIFYAVVVLLGECILYYLIAGFCLGRIHVTGVRHCMFKVLLCVNV